ncbi:type II toxin-antitoxin system HipA family toxin [Leifsonia sp. ZF2019]|uniref:type II toxin-antitoxin system HipA family toxin n=1 Tax=Leifsonia sp. ZF2019 TaxID=2781978 RepID=UPI001CBE5155|nr:HipA domain-containing protein [Leifsonia sp. ZF2019]
MSELVVELYGRRIGVLTGERDSFDFTPDADAMRHYGVGSTALSIAVPLATPRSDGLALRRNFFEEILAEGRIRERLGANARLDAENTVGLLKRYGRDVAGAVQIWDPEDAAEPRTPATRPVTDQEIASMFAEVKKNPLGNKGRRRLSSLAGVQDKVLLALTGEGWAEPLDGYPSTHILKPVVGSMPSLIFDEEYGSRFARALGLADFTTTIASFDGTRALVIERYDRDERRERIHQEDFNQVLGYRGDAKYEPEAGDGRLRQIAQTVREYATVSDVRRLVRMMTLSAAVGNLDMHAKNISILHLPGDRVRLAPMYDVVPQLHQDVDQETALLINGTNAIEKITGGDLVAEAAGWGVRDAEAIVAETLEEIVAVVAHEKPLPGAHPSLSEDIRRQTMKLQGSLASTSEPGAAEAHPRPGRDEIFPTRNAPGGWGGPVG